MKSLVFFICKLKVRTFIICNLKVNLGENPLLNFQEGIVKFKETLDDSRNGMEASRQKLGRSPINDMVVLVVNFSSEIE